MKQSWKLPIWLRRMDRVKAELKAVRYPRTAEEGLRQCAELSEIAGHWFLEFIRSDHPGASDCSELTGLLTADGREKRWAAEFSGLASRLAGKRMTPATLRARPALDWDSAISDPKAAPQYLAEYTKAFAASRKPAAK